MLLLVLLVLLLPQLVWGGTITRPVKSNGSTSFTNGMVLQDSDLNGDPNTIYSEFNGNISNVNIATAAAIAASKINPDGFTANVRTVSAAPCYVLEESDQSADAKKWAACLVSGELRFSTYTDAGAVQNDWLKINRSNGGVTMGGSGGTNTINGPTTFTHTVTFSSGNSLMPTGAVVSYFGTSPPAGWLLVDGASNSCTGGSGVNASLCALMVGTSTAYKGSAFATITVDTSSDEIIHTAHGLSTNARVHFSTTTTLPSPLVNTTVYCIISTTTDRYKISTTCGGAAVDITTNGSGTHSDYLNFLVPDGRGRNLIGTGLGAGLTNRTLGANGGEETHLLSTAEMPAHTHSVIGSTGSVDGGGAGAYGLNTGSTTTGSAGSGGTHNVMDPFLVLTYIIKL